MTTKAKKLNELIDALPGVCSGGKEGIRKLVSEITGEVLTEPAGPTYRIGDHMKVGSKTFLISVVESGMTPKVQAIDINTGARRGSVAYPVRSLYDITEREMRRILGVTFMSSVSRVHRSAIVRSGDDCPTITIAPPRIDDDDEIPF